MNDCVRVARSTNLVPSLHGPLASLHDEPLELLWFLFGRLTLAQPSQNLPAAKALRLSHPHLRSTRRRQGALWRRRAEREGGQLGVVGVVASVALVGVIVTLLLKT